jgi:transcriptional regulator with XRE-family HTH domain
MSKLEKLKAIAVAPATDWEKNAANRQANRAWLKHSQAIALRVLRVLRAKKMSQLQLAEVMKVTPQQINKIVKGSENLSLETIAKLEEALGVSLMALPEYRHVEEYRTEPILIADSPRAYISKAPISRGSYSYAKSVQTTKTNILLF